MNFLVEGDTVKIVEDYESITKYLDDMIIINKIQSNIYNGLLFT